MGTFGKVSLDDVGNYQSKNKYDKEKYLKLEDGVNNIRMVSDVYRYFYHKVEFDGDKNQYGRSIRCTTVKEECPLCLKGLRASEKFYIAVIDRKVGQNKIKILECGKTIVEGIKSLTQIPGRENPRFYELVIIKNSKNPPANIYSVVPGLDKALTADEIQMVESFDEDELVKLCDPISADEVLKTMDRIQTWIAKSNNKDESKPQNKNIIRAQASDEPQAEETVSDSSFEFNVKRKGK